MSWKRVLGVLALAVLLAALVAVVGRPFGEAPTVSPAVRAEPGSALGLSSTVAPPLPCTTVFTDRFPIDTEGADTTCADDSGTTRELAAIACADGRYLWTPPTTSGAPLGWGFDQGTYHAVTGALAADRGYQQALKTCLT